MNVPPSYLYRTVVGALAQEHRMNVLANNLANSNTTGFKRDVPVFEGFVVKATATYFAQGQLESTGNRLDMALQGPGFFQIEHPRGMRYSRDGAFTLNADRQLVNMDGYPVAGVGAIPEDVTDLSVTEDGRVMADEVEVGQIELVEFPDPRVLMKEGNSYFVPKREDITGDPAENTLVEQGFLERSNVDPVAASVNLIDTVRTYEVFQKVILSFEEADQKSINEVGRLM